MVHKHFCRVALRSVVVSPRADLERTFDDYLLSLPEILCNKFFPSDLIYELDKQEVISLKKIQEEVNIIQFDMIKNYNNLVSLCGGQGYSFEKVLYTEQ